MCSSDLDNVIVENRHLFLSMDESLQDEGGTEFGCHERDWYFRVLPWQHAGDVAAHLPHEPTDTQSGKNPLMERHNNKKDFVLHFSLLLHSHEKMFKSWICPYVG